MELPKSNYTGVYTILNSGKYIRWVAVKKHEGKMYRKSCKTEREAALAYDKMCLSFGLDPVNILKRQK